MSMTQKHIVIDARNRRSSTGRYTDRLLEHLQTLHSNHRYTVLVQPDDPWRARGANFEMVSCPFPQFSFNPLNDFRFAYQLRSLHPDLVHFTMTQQPLTYRGRVVTTTHDLTMLNFVRAGRTPGPIFGLKKLGYRLLFYVAHKKSSAVIVPTKYVAGALAEYLPFMKDKTSVTYEASEPPIIEEAIQPKGIKAPFIFHVGSPFPHKNIQHLVKAFEVLQKKDPSLRLVLAGKKEFYFEELEAWVRKRPIYPFVDFTGFIEDNELKWLYENAEAYVLPSLSEGFGLPGLEAMAHDCPLVSSNATCLPEVYGEAAVYFDPTDILDTAKAIEKVLEDDKLAKKLVKNGREQLKKYSWHTMAEETLDVYDKTLEV
jgi:glycosyltransferase involved in cell wall biosynthesis